MADLLATGGSIFVIEQ